MSCSVASALLEEDNASKEEPNRDEEQELSHCAQEGERSLPMSLNEVARSPSPRPPDPRSISDHLPSPLLDHIPSPINAQIFDFCDPDIFNDALQNSEVTSSPNCCGYEDQNSSYATSLSFPSNITDYQSNNYNNRFVTESLDISNFQGDQNDHTTNTSTTCSTPTTTTNISASTQHHEAFLFVPQDDMDNDISASIDFSPSPSFSAAPYNFNNLSSTANTAQQDQHHYQLPLGGDQHVNMTSNNNGFSQYPTTPLDPSVLPLMAGHAPAPAPLGTVFEDDCISPIPPFLRFNPSTVSATSSSSSCSSFLDRSMGSFLPGNLDHGLGSDNSGIFTGNLLVSSELQRKELDYNGDNGGIFCHDQLLRVYNSGDMQQAFSNESSQLVSAATSSAPLATEISSLSEDSTMKAGKLTAEQRKEKIHRYMKKRNERNFSKKIKYACRKTLADSRPRVRGRFAKNDDFGDASHRHINGRHHEEDDYEEVQVKEEDDLLDSSAIFSHISGVNSFKCNYQIQSWI